jgi:hypothetical protein
LAVAPVSTGKRRAARRGKEGGEKLPPSIRLKQKQSGREKRISTGFAWDLFLGAGLFGVPLFWRRLHQWGAVILALWCLDLLIGRVPVAAATARIAEATLFVAFLALQLWLGFRGNRLTAKAFLAHGWTVDQSGDLGAKRVIERWKLAN